MPQDAYNSTGDRLRTDGAIAVLRIGECAHPATIPAGNAVPPNRFERVTRDTVLTLKNDIWRGNLGYQNVQGTMWLRNYFLHKDDLKPEAGEWRKTDVSGAEFKGVGSVPADRQPAVRTGAMDHEKGVPVPVEAGLEQAHRWDPPRYEIGVMGGYLRYPHTRYEMLGAFLVPTEDVNEPTWDVGFQDEIRGGWSAGVFLTANTWRWVSNEFGYHYQHGTFLIGTYFANLAAENEQGQVPSISTAPVGLVTRQFEYNVLVHLRRPESRWRPYVAIGPALELISLADSPIKKAPKPFLLGLRNIGVLVSAFDFGSTPALDGGGIWELGLQYGAGIKFRVHPRITLSADFRETWAKNPEFIRSSYTASYFVMEGYTPRFFYGSNSTSSFRQQRFTLGIAYTF